MRQKFGFVAPRSYIELLASYRSVLWPPDTQLGLQVKSAQKWQVSTAKTAMMGEMLRRFLCSRERRCVLDKDELKQAPCVSMYESDVRCSMDHSLLHIPATYVCLIGSVALKDFVSNSYE